MFKRLYIFKTVQRALRQYLEEYHSSYFPAMAAFVDFPKAIFQVCDKPDTLHNCAPFTRSRLHYRVSSTVTGCVLWHDSRVAV
jgi:hypothetical protein